MFEPRKGVLECRVSHRLTRPSIDQQRSQAHLRSLGLLSQDWARYTSNRFVLKVELPGILLPFRRSQLHTACSLSSSPPDQVIIRVGLHQGLELHLFL